MLLKEAKNYFKVGKMYSIVVSDNGDVCIVAFDNINSKYSVVGYATVFPYRIADGKVNYAVLAGIQYFNVFNGFNDDIRLEFYVAGFQKSLIVKMKIQNA